MPGESYCRRLRSLLLSLFDIFRALIINPRSVSDYFVKGNYDCDFGISRTVFICPNDLKKKESEKRKKKERKKKNIS